MARSLRLIPNHSLRAGGDVASPAIQTINHGAQGDQSATQPQVTEITLNDVRHVSSLLALNGSIFVDAVYRAFLKRSPDRAGRDHFLDRLQAGHGKEAVLLAIATSREAQALGTAIEGLPELRAAQARRGTGWFGFGQARDRALEARLNRLEYTLGEAHNTLVDRLERIQDAVDRTQSALVSGAAIRAGHTAVHDGSANGVAQSIKRGITVGPANSAPEFIDALKREVRASSEAQTLRRA